MNIPEKFIIHGHDIIVKVVDTLPNNEYGNYNHAKEEITIAKKIVDDNEVIELTPIQIEHTFIHELIHLFQFHVKGEFDEGEAQAYSGLLIEFLNTKK
jgi:hypothetical protein